MVYSEQVDGVFVLVLLMVTHADKKVPNNYMGA